MIKLAETLGRVMMSIITLPRSADFKHDGYRRYAEIEFGKDSSYVYDCLTNNRSIDLK